MKFKISRHAHEEIGRREISLSIVESVLHNPQQIVNEYGNKKAYQSIINTGTGKDYLVRVIVSENTDPAKVITIYKTSKIRKYWSEP